MMRYWGDKVGSKGISTTVPARLQPDCRVVLRTLVLGGYGSLMTGVLSWWSNTKRPPPYLIVGYTKEVVGINLIAVRLVIALVAWVVDKYGI